MSANATLELLEGFRLSPQQKHLWLLQNNEKFYCAQIAVSINGNLDLDVLKTAIEKAIAKHDILRTKFICPRGVKVPLQIIEEQIALNWNKIDLAGIDHTEIERLAKQEINRLKSSFSFPQLQALLIKISPQEHFLILTLPALHADRKSLDNLVIEIIEAYQFPRKLDEDVVQYVQFSEWQNELIAERSDSPNKVELAETDNLVLPFQLRKNNSGSECDRSSQKLSFSLLQLLEDSELNIRSFFLACWLVLLNGFTERSPLTIAYLDSGRNEPELESTIGLFANYVPLSYEVKPEETFSNLLARVKRSLTEVANSEYLDLSNLDVTSYQVLPFAFNFYSRKTRYQTKDLTWEIATDYIDSDTKKIQISILQTELDLSCQITYDVNLFDTKDVDYFLRCFHTLVESAAKNPDASTEKLEMLTQSDRQQLLLDFNNTKTDFPQDKCIHHLFEEQVKRTPNNIAVVCESEQLTYAELDAKANQIANDLRNLGVKPDVVVGMRCERSVEAIAIMFGILKAGGAYLPLDPTLPPKNLELRLQDAQATILIDNSTQLELQCIASVPAENIKSETLNLNHLAYIIYTSGSTGKPKGVAVEHRQLLNYVYSIQERLNLPLGASYATVSTLAADLGNTTIFPALCTGGCLHIISTECATNPHAFAEYCRQHPIDCLKIVPSHLETLLSSTTSADFLPRQRLILGGEACSWQLIRQIKELTPNCEIYNHYGPTETTVGVLTYRVEEIPEDPISQIVPLGTAIANTQLYILDKYLQPVPIGVVGELYIGGNNVARGYIHQPKLTQERFIPHPFSQKVGDRLYQTGDLARYNRDGNLEFVGRMDNQIKIRGYRVEIEEIEVILSHHPDVKQAAVTFSQQKGLSAYIVSASGGINSQSLRDFLKLRLPDYAIPTAFIPLKTLPLTPNGKVDRNAIATLESNRKRTESKPISPRELVELQLTQIWESLLTIRPIGVTDNFFEIGGHSLLAVRLVAQIEQYFNYQIPVAKLLQEPTIERLAAIIRQQPQNASTLPLICLQSQGHLQPFFCVHPIGGNVICYYDLAKYLAPNRPFYGLEAPGLYGECEPLKSIEDLATYYIAAMRRVQPQGSYLIGGWSMGGIVALEIARQLEQQDEKVDLLALLDTNPPLKAYQPQTLDDVSDAKLLADIAIATANFQGNDLDNLGEEIERISPDNQLAYVWKIMKELEFIPPDIGLDKLGNLLNVYRANNQGLINYKDPGYEGKINLFIATENDNYDNIQISAKNYIQDWHKLAGDRLIKHSVPGDHASILTEPNVQLLAKQIEECIETLPAKVNIA
ncbi:non-ribosomal peptide synthetase [Merismopedia glauca CCAP 1448/3]|uniref:Non-ribosomal peptide synthetase n=2 Tax=Merismopedia TaxID=53402 RepID=A0A2T1C0F8_9CYAN|nr:non-ribosomal peptide synthetase [Merismopedia glauca CCAP 1448/3]